MQHRIVRKGLVGGIIAILILVCLPQNESAEELPDFIVKQISADFIDFPITTGTEVEIKNIGNGSASGEMYVRLDVRRMFLGIIPLNLVYTRLHEVSENSFSPGESHKESFQYIPEQGLRFYKFTATVDVKEAFEESNEQNNVYSEIFFITDPETPFGWIGLGWLSSI